MPQTLQLRDASRESEAILLAYAYYGTTELAYQVTSRSENSEWYGEYKLIYYNADSVNIIAVAIWLKGSAWHRGYARSYPGMPSASSTSRKRSLPSEPQHNSSTTPPSQQQPLDAPKPTINDITKPELPQIHLIGGPRYKSAGLDPTWFASMMIPPAAVAVPESRLKPILTKKTERVFVA
ncbi:MAG: hypothetical protein Q9223_002422 [Gallowayella weberi]